MNNISHQISISTDKPGLTLHTIEDIQKAFTILQGNCQALKNSSINERLKKLKKLEELILASRPEIEHALLSDLGKSSFESGVSEIFSTLSEIRNFRKHLPMWMRDEKVPSGLTFLGSESRIIYEPKGLCLIITPWNYPFYLTISHMVACVAAGNCAIVKPSEFTPHTTAVIHKIIGAIFPEDQVVVVNADASVSAQIVKMPFNHIHFTGSTATGKLIMAAAGENLCSVTLELGGKSPVIIDEDFPIRRCISQIGWGKFLNAGQTCIAPDYILVHERKKDELISGLKRYLTDNFGLTGMEKGTLTSIIHQRHFGKLENLLDDALSKGASVSYGGTRDRARLKFAPTVIEIGDLDAQVMQEEIFGPVLPVISYSRMEEALDIIHSRPKPLAMYLFSRSDKWLDMLLENTSSGGVCINDTMAHFVQTYLPMGGVNHSGIGKSHGYYGFLEFSNQRSVLRSYLPNGITAPFHFPVKRWKKRLLDLMIRYL